MAMKLNAGEVGRSDLYAFFPDHIVINHADNSRAVPHTTAEIEALAASILEYGQQQAAVVRRIDGNRVQLVAGYGRWQAVTLINSLQPDKPVKLKCAVTDLKAEEAFVRSIVENADRKDCSAVDHAYAQRRLREVFGWSEKRIAILYESSVSHVGQLRKVLQLSTPLQAEIANGHLPVSTALDVAELPEAEREEVVSEATDPATGKVDGAAIREVVRRKKQAAGGAKARTLAEVRLFFDEQTGPGETEAVRELAKAVCDFIAGRISDEEMVEALGGAVRV